MIRCQNPGWVEVIRPDERRGLWIRTNDKTIELCAGREGDDAYVSFSVGDTITPFQMYQLRDVLETAAYAVERGVANRVRRFGHH